MTYRPGDEPTPLGPLRLTVSALAEIADRLGASGPGQLAKLIRDLGPDRARHLLVALLRPSGTEQRVTRLSDREVADLMPSVARCISRALEQDRS